MEVQQGATALAGATLLGRCGGELTVAFNFWFYLGRLMQRSLINTWMSWLGT